MASSTQQFRIGLLRDGATRMTCVESNCAQERGGWVNVLDLAVEGHRKYATAIRADRTRHHIQIASEGAVEYLEAHGAELGISNTTEISTILGNTPPGMAVFIFPPGQQCFRQHLDREVLFVHEAPNSRRVHTRPVDFNEHMNEEADRINRIRQRG